MDVGYANGLAGTAGHTVTVDGVPAGTVSYPSMGAWLGGPRQDAVERTATVRLTTGWRCARSSGLPRKWLAQYARWVRRILANRRTQRIPLRFES